MGFALERPPAGGCEEEQAVQASAVQVLWLVGRHWRDSSKDGVQIRRPPKSLPGLTSVVCDLGATLLKEHIQVTALRHAERLRMAGATSRGPRALQLLQDDLNLAVHLPHVQQEGHMVAVMLNDVVVHVDQDPGREEGLGWNMPGTCALAL